MMIQSSVYRKSFSLVACLMLLVGEVYAGSYALVPLQSYSRSSGSPVTETLLFNARDTASEYQVNVYNGGLEDHDLTGELVSSSTLHLNGDVLFSPNEFNQKTAILNKTINVDDTNTIDIILKGKPGGLILIEVIGEDDIPPNIIATVTPLANTSGWHNEQAVVISYQCNDGQSGVANCPADKTITIEDAMQVITGTATDVAGNEATATVTLNLDQTSPIITSSANPPANVNGWNNVTVIVTYSCSDPLSDIASCSTPVTVSNEGADQIFTGQAADNADNSATTTHTLNIDKTAPVMISAAVPLPNAAGWNNSAVTVSFDCQDPLSGNASCSAPTTVSAEGQDQIVTGQASDIADNTASLNHTLSVDLTPPVMASTALPLPNAAGWNNSAVTVSFDCQDPLSGNASCSAPTTVSAEGQGQVVTGQASDIADNSTSLNHTLSLDLTAPEISTTLSAPANLNGWYNADVTTTFICSDLLSGYANCPLPFTLIMEGASQAISGSVTDNADNTATTSVSLNLDKTAPVMTSAAVPLPNAAGWNNSAVTVSFDCQDPLSGNASCSAPTTVSAEGQDQIVTGQASDIADNAASLNHTLSVDLTPPVMASTALPLPNTAGWNNSAVTVSFDCQDPLSGNASCSAPTTVSAEGQGQVVTGQASDIADNTVSLNHTLSLDLTAPEISTTLSAPANLNGWYNADVTTTFICSDLLSGYTNCPLPFTLIMEGASQAVSGSVTDNADNTATTSVSLNLDKTAPVMISAAVPLPNAAGWNNSAVTVSFDCQDPLSGNASCSAPTTVSAEGQDQVVTGQASDIADNTASLNHALNIDLTQPSITMLFSAVANSADWHNTDLTIDYLCTDELSGIVICPQANEFVTEGLNQLIEASVVDIAGNNVTTTAIINLDKTPPAITASTSPAPNTNGWNNSSVTVNFDCQDTLSGISDCTQPTVLELEGAAQVVIGQGVDIADNVTQLTQNVDIDLTPPIITTQFSAVANNAGWYNTPVTLSFTCNDMLSGIQNCPSPITVMNDVQGHSITVTADDKADNSVSQQHVINLDTTPPQVVFSTPTAGTELASLQPVIEFTLSDNIAIDDTSLVLTVNGLSFTGNCNISSNSATVCTPTADFPRGAIQLQATITDLAGNSTTATHDFRIQEDRDNDGVPDLLDIFPDDAAEWADLDGDGTGDNGDTDRDGDGIGNDYEIQVGTDPSDASSTPSDADTDGIPDSVDDDLDGDSVPNAQDLFPNDPTESSDLDGDGIGDNADTDRDGDGFSNDEETEGGSNPNDANDLPGANLRITFLASNPTSADEQFINLSGTVYGETIDHVYLSSDQYAGTKFAATVSNNSWEARVALRLGSNIITAHVIDNAQEVAEAVTTIERNELPPIIEIVFDTPANNTLLTTPDVVISGRLITETLIELPQINVNNITAEVVQGQEATEFKFTVPLTLNEGGNTIFANSVISGQAIQQSMTLHYQPDTVQTLPPAVGIITPQPGSTLTTENFLLSVRVLSDAGIATVFINGQAETPSTAGQIEKTFSFAGSSQRDITIIATDNLGQTTTLDASYTLDSDTPTIQVDSLQPYPAENTVTDNPYQISGSVTDATLLQLTLNGQALTLTPTVTPNNYHFEANIAVPAAVSNSLVFEAVDAAGNTTSAEYLLVANSNIQIEWLTPTSDAPILLETAGQMLDISARLSEVTGIGDVQVEVVGESASPLLLTLDTDIASGQLTLPDVEGDYTLRISVLNTVGDVLTTSNRTIKLQSAQALALSILKITPADESNDIEPNGFFGIFFNKPIELSKLTITLHETAHGFSYVDVDAPGVSSIHARGFVLQEINRDHEAVPGLFSLLPNNTTATFYPQRDMAYGADLYLNVSYEGTELARHHFKVRPRPTFIDGAIRDNLGQAVVGVEVSIPKLNRKTVTNSEGSYSFGYGDPAANTLPKGNYQLLVNPGLKDSRFSSHTGQINIEAGARNQQPLINLPVLNKNVPFSYLSSGSESVLNGNELTLNATDAKYLFNDRRDQGAVHMQFLPFGSLKLPAFKINYTPMWAYAVQPSGIQVDGDLQLEFTLPKYKGEYAYAPEEGELVVLLGANDDATRLVPVGVGETIAGHRIRSVGPTNYKLLDYIAYARVIPDQVLDLLDYRNGKINIQELEIRLQTFTFTPPANEAEAIQRRETIQAEIDAQ
jgi:hypothetical protein